MYNGLTFLEGIGSPEKGRIMWGKRLLLIVMHCGVGAYVNQSARCEKIINKIDLGEVINSKRLDIFKRDISFNHPKWARRMQSVAAAIY